MLCRCVFGVQRIKANEIKQMSHENEKTPLDQVSDVLLYREELSDVIQQNEQEKYKISYKRTESQLLGGDHDATNATSVKIAILKTCFNNLVRPVWEGLSIDVQHEAYENLPSFVQNALPDPSDKSAVATFSSSGLAFPLMLGNTISKLQNEAESLQKQKQQLNVDALRWKNSLEKLTGKWEEEKMELTQNFLALFNQHKARHVETQQKLAALTKQSPQNELAGTLSNKRLKRDERETVPDDEDNHDYADFDQEMVDRLAAGLDGRKKIAKPKVKTEMRAEDITSSMGSTFHNPVTGVVMLTDHKRLFDSDSDDEVSTSKKRKG